MISKTCNCMYYERLMHATEQQMVQTYVCSYIVRITNKLSFTSTSTDPLEEAINFTLLHKACQSVLYFKALKHCNKLHVTFFEPMKTPTMVDCTLKCLVAKLASRAGSWNGWGCC